MSNVKKAVCLLSPLIAYAISAFVLWEVNPSDWTEEARAVSVFVAMVIFLGALTFPEDAFK